MSNKKDSDLHIRLGIEDRIKFSAKAEAEGLSCSELGRRIIHEYLSADHAKSSLDTFIPALRDTLKTLDHKFLELKNLERKILSLVSTNKFLELSILEHATDLDPLDVKGIFENARKSSYMYLRENSTYDEEELE